MKTLSILSVVLILLMSCNNPTPTTEEVDNTKIQQDYTIKVIDSCEYIEVDDGMGYYFKYTLTHKGNCKFCKERGIYSK